jgi:putative ABC transport system substrate-binding protein
MPQNILKRALTAIAVLAGLAAPAAADQASVATTAIVEHPALDAARDGLRDELAAGGYEVGKNLTFLYESAQGNPATAAQIARKFIGEAPDVIVPISTPSAQAVVAATKEIPVVFTAVTDPLGARLVAALDKPGGNVTGMSDLSPIDKQMALVKRITPETGKLGVIFNPGEANSLTLLKLIHNHAPDHGLKVVEAPATKSADVLAAAQSLVGKADAIYVPTDNTVVSALEAVIKVGIDNQVPVYAGDTDSVSRGVIAALGFNYYDVGRQTGRIVLRVLKGEAPGEIAVQGVEITELHVNPGAAKKMGVTIPSDVIAEAKKVIE